MAKGFFGHADENYFTESDKAASPVTSPASVSNSSKTTLEVPDRAAEVTIYASAALRVSSESAMTHYFLIPATTLITIPVATMDYIYLLGDSGTVTVQFIFRCV
jgi:hypothetical protein